MVGSIIALIILLLIIVVFVLAYRSASKCSQGQGGVLCKIWHWLA